VHVTVSEFAHVHRSLCATHDAFSARRGAPHRDHRGC
jgi:hypothetical protein